MKKMLLITSSILALSLAACSPANSTNPGNLNRVPDTYSTTEVLTGPKAPGVLFNFKTGSVVVESLLMYFGGKGLQTDNTACKLIGNGIGCTFKMLQPGQSVGVVLRGTDISSTYYIQHVGEPLPDFDYKRP